MPELAIFIGLQGAGKTTFYRTHLADTHVLVSKDLLRNNRKPARRQEVLIKEALAAGRSVVVDNTNPTKEERATLIDIGRSFGTRVIGYYFDSSIADCLERNRRRTGKHKVPDVALYATRKRLQSPSLAEGFDHIYFVRAMGDSHFDLLNWNET